MPPVIPFGTLAVVMGVVLSIKSGLGYVEHLATPPVELALGSHPLSIHVMYFAGGVLLILAGMWETVGEHRERKRRRESERKWEEMYERTRPMPPHWLQ